MLLFDVFPGFWGGVGGWGTERPRVHVACIAYTLPAFLAGVLRALEVRLTRSAVASLKSFVLPSSGSPCWLQPLLLSFPPLGELLLLLLVWGPVDVEGRWPLEATWRGLFPFPSPFVLKRGVNRFAFARRFSWSISSMQCTTSCCCCCCCGLSGEALLGDPCARGGDAFSLSWTLKKSLWCSPSASPSCVASDSKERGVAGGETPWRSIA